MGGVLRGRTRFTQFSAISQHFPQRFSVFSGKVTTTPAPEDTPDHGLDQELLNHLERTSLVDFSSAEAVVSLSEAIKFAGTLEEVDTTGVEPLVSINQHEPLRLREDLAEVTTRSDILRNAAVTEEDYFVAPPGNIPLEKSQKKQQLNDLLT